jgi:aminopeptidase N
METDARLSTHAMRQPVGDDVNLSQLADALAYDKGQAVLGMFEQWLGPETFRRGVLDYINQHEWGNAVGADLWTALSRASDRDVSGPMSSFLERPGVPLVSAEPLAGGRVRLRQQRFLNFGTKDPEPTLWKIPITLRYAVGQQTFTQSVLLAAPEQTVVLDHPGTPAWVHPNADQRGYYRWSVPPATLQELAAHAAAGLNARERVGFLSNAESLLDAGTIHGDEYLRLLGQFSADADPEVVTTILSGLTKVHRTFGPDLEPGFSAFVRQTLSPAVKRFGMTPTRGEPERVSVLRPRLLEVLADFGRDPAVLEQVRAWAATYLEDPMAVDPSVADVALSLAARRGDSARFEEYRTRFEGATLPTERARYLLALGGFRDPALVERTLAYALQGPLRPQEILRLPRGIAEAPEYQDRTYRWMTENHGAIVKRIPPLFAASMPWFAGGCSAQRLEMARTFFADPAHSPVGTDREFAEMSEGVLDCVGLNQREAAAVARYLSQMAAAK